jgi:hypothetical protein
MRVLDFYTIVIIFSLASFAGDTVSAVHNAAKFTIIMALSNCSGVSCWYVSFSLFFLCFLSPAGPYSVICRVCTLFDAHVW